MCRLPRLPTENANIARHLGLMAASQPLIPALKIPRGRTRDGRIDYLALTFAELNTEVDAWAAHLAARGVRRGDRVLVLVRQGLPLIATAFALFKLGAVPVLLDPGMGRENFLACVARTRPRVLLGILPAWLLSYFFRPSFRSVKLRVFVSSRPTARRSTLSAQIPAQMVASAPDELAAILFTSGSTGAPKGVCYTHGMFEAQVRLVRETYGIEPGEIDLPLLPIFALFNPALGMTTIVPELDPRRPADLDPVRIVQAIQQEKVTNSFGSPTLWRKLARHCQERQINLPGVRRVLCAGAPVPPELWKSMADVLPHGVLHSPYGATEALPVSTISSPEVTAAITAATLAGGGTCVGRVLPANRVKIIALSDGPLATLADTRELPSGEIGEIIVTGPSVTREYDALPEATGLAKIQGSSDKYQESELPGSALVPSNLSLVTSAPPSGGAVWHRMGDTGYLDGEGRLWFCGRRAERINTVAGPLYTEQVEPFFNTHAGVRRTALIALDGGGRHQAAVVIEPMEAALIKDSDACRRFTRQLRAFGQPHPYAGRIEIFYFHPAFPVDVRHNVKIHRLALARWAATAKGYRSNPKR